MKDTKPFLISETLEDVLLNVGKGDNLAFKTLYDRYRPNIYTTALRLTDDQNMAEDIVQDTFVKVWINRNTLPYLDNFETWIYVLARNIAINIIKKRGQYKIYASEEAKQALVRVYPAADYDLQDKEFQQLLKRAVDRLPAKQKETYRLIKEQYLKRNEAAELLRVSPETVKWNLEQAVKSIRAYCLANMKDLPFVLILHFFFKNI